jgi:hypothetical protein
MIRTTVIFALLVVAAQAFVSPANRAVGESQYIFHSCGFI